jgi:mono/diheme cytochrome c family protein
MDQEGGWDGPMRLRRMRADGDGSDAETLLEPDELVYSLAFHPKFAENGFVYLGANGPRGSRPRSSEVIRYTVRDGKPDPASRTIVIDWPSDGHNGAALAFANDGMLFVTSGDGTSTSDLDRVGQEPSSLRSKILRIDVDHPAPGKNYAVPRDNPFVDDKRFRAETWAYGLRNPWRLTYDSVSGQLWSGENGQDQWEYARLVQRGANYGWSVYEGAHPFHKNQKLGPHPVTFPTIEFSHAEFRSLTGGIVYRGKHFPELVGAYVFGDFNTGRVWAAKHDGARLEWMRELIDTPFALTHITADAAGELVVLDYGFPTNLGNATPRGGIYRIERAPPPTGPVPEFPRRLSATGLFSDPAKLTPAAGVVRYEVNLPGWHDGASSEHVLALPAGTTLEVRPSRSWQAPNETVLAQTLTIAGQRIETRVLVKQQNDWAGYTYLWNSAQTDAELAEKTGAEITVGATAQPWRVPSRAECMMCHSREANFALTLNESQLNRGNQLAQWERLGLLTTDASAYDRRRPRFDNSWRTSRPPAAQRTAVASGLLPRNMENLRKYAAPGDPGASLESRARSYLGVNCAHCHTTNGGGNSVMDFDATVSTERMRSIGQPPQHGDLGITDAKIIAAGAPARSVLIPRMGTRAPGQMPPVGTRTADSEGLRVMAEWIASLRE